MTETAERDLGPYWSCQECGVEYPDPGVVPEQCPYCDSYADEQ